MAVQEVFIPSADVQGESKVMEFVVICLLEVAVRFALYMHHRHCSEFGYPVPLSIFINFIMYYYLFYFSLYICCSPLF